MRDGELSVVVGDSDLTSVPRSVTEMRRGDTFGEFAIFGREQWNGAVAGVVSVGVLTRMSGSVDKRSASVICKSYCSVFVLEKDMLLGCVAGMADAAVSLVRAV